MLSPENGKVLSFSSLLTLLIIDDEFFGRRTNSS